MNLNYCAEFSPSPAGRSPQRDWNSSREVRERVGVGVFDIAHELKFCFFNYLLPSPQPSLATRAVPVPQGEGAYWLFSRFSVSYTSTRKNAIPQDFEQVLKQHTFQNTSKPGIPHEKPFFLMAHRMAANPACGIPPGTGGRQKFSKSGGDTQRKIFHELCHHSTNALARIFPAQLHRKRLGCE